MFALSTHPLAPSHCAEVGSSQGRSGQAPPTGARDQCGIQGLNGVLRGPGRVYFIPAVIYMHIVDVFPCQLMFFRDIILSGLKNVSLYGLSYNKAPKNLYF